MALLFQAVLMVVYVARETWGQSGVFASAAVLGSTRFRVIAGGALLLMLAAIAVTLSIRLP